ncbi:hypothetical protein [Heliorestis convoluta]|uniref:Uncharacterized protein n=1 Tax=Heliorestis convoluta TaxID=356322 RepID=A0A5Q2N2A6_9FIRM|nr:hypothetical protein [Heliorestis convoluta]QGG47412.1 hypothetical protein FTV88_1265 [Heliorestis convoluta]
MEMGTEELGDIDTQSPEIQEWTDKNIALEKELEGDNERIEKAKEMHKELECWLLGGFFLYSSIEVIR